MQHPRKRVLSILLSVSLLLSLTVLPAAASEPAKATLELDDDLLSLDMSQETFTATLTVPSPGNRRPGTTGTGPPGPRASPGA